MRNIDSYGDFLNEKVVSQFVKNNIIKDKKATNYLRSDIDLNKITDDAFQEIPDPKVITKKPYSSGDYLVLVFGNYNEYIPIDKREAGKEYEQYKKIYGLLYVIRGTSVYSVNASHSRKGDKTPTVRQLLKYSEGYKFYSVDVSDKSLNQKRRERSNNKFGTPLWFRDRSESEGPTSKQQFDEDISKKNRDRYSNQLKDIKAYYKIFDKIEKLLETVHKENIAINAAFKYIIQDENFEKSKHYNVKYELDKLSALPKEYIDAFGKIDYTTLHSDKTLALKIISKKLYDLLTGKLSEDELKRVKAIEAMIDKFPMTSTSAIEKYINENIWKDSDILKKTNKSTGLFDE
jgi:hypothetical protein